MAVASCLVIPAKSAWVSRASALAVEDRRPLVVIASDQGRPARLQIQCQSYSTRLTLAATAAAAGAEGLRHPLPQAISAGAATWAAAFTGWAAAGPGTAAAGRRHGCWCRVVHVGAEGGGATGGQRSSCCGLCVWRQGRPTCAAGAAWRAGDSASNEHLRHYVLPLNHGADLCLNVGAHILNGQDACRQWEEAGMRQLRSQRGS